MDPDCTKCGLLKLGNGPVPDDGGDYSILIVGEAPGAAEDKEGVPFVGTSGQLLRGALDYIGYPPDETTYTNIVRCRPPDNTMKTKYIKCCYRSLPIRSNTGLVLLLGNTPLKAVLGEAGITQWNGVIVERDGIIYAPAYHPAYFLYRNDQKRMDSWLRALTDALDAYYEGAKAPADEKYTYTHPVTSLPEISQMCGELMNSACIAFDVEFSNLDPYATNAKILAVSFANDTKAWAVPIAHPNQLAPASQTIIDMICKVLNTHTCIVGHNIKMDQMQMDVLWQCKELWVGGDSMLASFLLESVSGLHSLKRLAGVYLGMFDYDASLRQYVMEHPETNPSRGGSYANVPLSILLPYAAKDAAATFQLESLLRDKLSEKQQILYEQLMLPASDTLYRIQVNGMAIDASVADRYRRIYSMVKDDTLADIKDDAYVKKYVKNRKMDLSGKAQDIFEFNPNSWKQKSAVLYDKEYYGLEPLGHTDKGAPSTKREYIEPHRQQCPLADHLVLYGMIGKMLGTYIIPVATGMKLSGDGRARSSFNQHIVGTGRLSSSSFSKNLGFNQQNIPVPEKEPGTILEYQPIKNMFTHTWEGGCLMSTDYAGMELRVFASLSECYDMIDIHKSGRDFHTMVGAMVSGKPYNKITKPERYRYKWVNWTLLYGGSEYTLERIYKIPMNEGRKIIRRYYDMFPEVPEYMEKCVQFAREHGYIETPFGNRRPLPQIHTSSGDRIGASRRKRAERAAVNTPVQGAAGLTTVMALVIIDELMRQHEYKSMLVNTVHDSILTDVYPGELNDVAQLQVDVMENIIEYSHHMMPDIDMSWLICPLAVDVEVGSHYGALDHYALE